VLVLLGPQRFRPTLRTAVRSLGIEGPIAVVTAGWQERESEDSELRDHLKREVIDLGLYHRAERVTEQDRELYDALRERQRQLQQLQELYRLRLSYALEAARVLMRRRGGGRMLTEQRRAAIRAVRTLDRWHLRRIRRLHEEFEARWQPTTRPAVERERHELAETLARTGALCIAGGHVAVLLGRLRLFDVVGLLREQPVIAWSAGAMAVTDRIVLFHDSPPQGAGDPEVLDSGLGLCRKLIALPHARDRLDLEDPVRVSLFARRFAPASCVVLEQGARIDWDGQRWVPGRGAQQLERRGAVRPMRTEAC